jgi:hypothetical protein
MIPVGAITTSQTQSVVKMTKIPMLLSQTRDLVSLKNKMVLLT